MNRASLTQNLYLPESAGKELVETVRIFTRDVQLHCENGHRMPVFT